MRAAGLQRALDAYRCGLARVEEFAPSRHEIAASGSGEDECPYAVLGDGQLVAVDRIGARAGQHLSRRLVTGRLADPRRGDEFAEVQLAITDGERRGAVVAGPVDRQGVRAHLDTERGARR